MLLSALISACVPAASLVSNPPAIVESGSLVGDNNSSVEYSVDDMGVVTLSSTVTSNDGSASSTFEGRGCGISHPLSQGCQTLFGVTVYTTVNVAGGIDVHTEVPPTLGN